MSAPLAAKGDGTGAEVWCGATALRAARMGMKVFGRVIVSLALVVLEPSSLR